MTFPAKTRAYTGYLNQRLTYSTLNAVMAQYAYNVKSSLLTHGFTLKYTCDGTTGPTSSSDHTDRISSTANVTTRGANSTTAQSFFVFTDANGADWMWTYQGASDDIGRWSYSPSGAYTPAGTANQQPTATDEVVVTSGTTLIASSTSADRVLHLMLSTDKKAMYLFVARSGVCVGQAIMIGSCTSAISNGAVSFSPAMVGLNASTFAPATYFNGSQSIGSSRATWSSVGITSTLIAGYETPPTSAFLDGVNPAAQGSAGGLMYPLSAWSTTASANGKIANLIDIYKDGNSKADGDLTTDSQWIHLTFSGSASAGVLWPWDGSTTPQMS